MSPVIGDTLREARQSRGVELREVERRTKIRVPYLRALEDERWDVLPGRAYARSFLRTYAELLRLDPDPLVARLDQQLRPVAEEELPPEPVIQRGPLTRRLRVRRILVAAVASVAAVGLILALTLSVDDEKGGRGDGAHKGTGGAASPSGQSAGAEPSAESRSAPPAETYRPSTTSAQVSVSLRAVGTVWFCVVDDRGELVDTGTLTDGERRGPFEAGGLEMSFGNGDVEITADGESVDVPAVAEPFGLEVTSHGTRDLAPSERPDCT
jgi:cytoskeleton protein RodZ